MNNRFIRTAYAVIQIALVLLAYLWYRRVTYYFSGPGKRRLALDRVHQRSADRLFRTFANLRGAYIKLAQFLSTQAILPAPYLIEFSKMQDQNSPVAFEIIEKALAREWGDNWRDNLESIDPLPLAAASIAQVHRARLKNGRAVVVKVQYPGIDAFFTRDLDLIEFMLPWYIKAVEMNYSELRTTINHSAMLRELFSYIARELDYENEVVYQKKMANLFRDWKSVVVPEVVDELSTKRIICMDFIEGTRILAWFDRADQESRDKVFETFADFGLYTMMAKGIFQADSHPGNFLITPDERLVLLDFGCIKELKPEFTKGSINLVKAYLNRDAQAGAEVLWGLGFRTQLQTVESLSKWVAYAYAIADTILEHFKHGHDLVAHMQSNLLALSQEFTDINREHAIAAVPEEYMLLGRALATPPVPFDKYRPQVDVMALALEHLAEAGRD
jgi:ubiquinone biosynthesis protein